MMQIATWGALLAVFMYWSVAHPFNFRQLKITGKIRHAHIISIALAVVLPLPSALIHLSGGTIITANLVLPCLGRNSEYNFFSNILPVSILISITLCVLALIIWILFKVSIKTSLTLTAL